jgi:hypothetical protein
MPRLTINGFVFCVGQWVMHRLRVRGKDSVQSLIWSPMLVKKLRPNSRRNTGGNESLYDVILWAPLYGTRVVTLRKPTSNAIKQFRASYQSTWKVLA